jgi:hypothetical protein
MHFKNQSIVAIIVLIAIYATWRYLQKHERFDNALNHPTKCFDCEKQFPPELAWMGQKTKCYSCEKQAFHMSGGNPSSVFSEHPIKYYTSTPLQGSGHANLGYM